jgi:hypothetical protein
VAGHSGLESLGTTLKDPISAKTRSRALAPFVKILKPASLHQPQTVLNLTQYSVLIEGFNPLT